MAKFFSITTDTREVLRAFDRLGPTMEQYTRPVAAQTARAIQSEARTRLLRQTHGTGETADAIRVTPDGIGYRVSQGGTSHPGNLPIWLEYGTIKMNPRSYWYAAVESESGPYYRRLNEAILDAINAAQ